MALVLCLHLLSTQGTWNVSDQAEMIFTARRLLTAGTFEFAPAGSTVPGMRWLRAKPGEPMRPRLFPGTPIALLPFVAVDHALALDRTEDLGLFVHFAGHFFIAGALVLLGSTLRLEGASDRAAVAAILITGTLWPVFQISRRGGAEPLLALLAAAFLAAATRKRFWPRATIAAALPWCHPTGSLLAPLLALSDAVMPGFWEGDALGARPRVRQVVWLLACAASSTLGVIVIWNWLYHGSLLGGGYALYGAGRAVMELDPLDVATYYVQKSLLFVPVLLLLTIGGALQAGRAGLRTIALPAVLLALFLALFSLYTHPTSAEPARRLSIVWLVFGFALGRTFDGLALRRTSALGLIALSMLLGLYWYRLLESDFYPWHDGSWEPLVLWITLAVQGRPFWWSAAPIAALSALGCYAAVRVTSAFLRDGLADTPRAGS